MSSARILIVDDVPDAVQFLETLLRAGGYKHLCSTNDSREVVSLFQTFQPDLILLDLMMPHLDGIQVLAQLRPLISTGVFVPIVVLTALTDAASKKQALQSGAHDFLTKPYQPGEVLLRIGNLLQIRDLQIHLLKQNHNLEEQVNESTRRRHEAQVALEALARSEEGYRRIVETANEGIWVLDASFRTTYVNQQWSEMLGYAPAEIIGRSPLEFVFEADRMELEQRLEQRSNGNREQYDFCWRRRDGSPLYTLCCTTPVFGKEGEFEGSFGMLTDISERKNAEQAAAALYQQLRDFTTHQQVVVEAERARIAREIHDELGQLLSVVKMGVFEMDDCLRGPSFGSDHDVFESGCAHLSGKLSEMSDLLDQTIHSVRRIARELRPSVLDDLGLIAALQWQAQQFEQRTEISCNFSTNCPELQVDANVATALFRIFQEALTNVMRHAQATAVQVHLHAQLHAHGESVLLQVEDNGCGIGGKPSSPETLGLLGMRERANLLGGSLQIQSVVGQGTKVVVSIPHANSSVG